MPLRLVFLSPEKILITAQCIHHIMAIESSVAPNIIAALILRLEERTCHQKIISLTNKFLSRYLQSVISSNSFVNKVGVVGCSEIGSCVQHAERTLLLLDR